MSKSILFTEPYVSIEDGDPFSEPGLGDARRVAFLEGIVYRIEEALRANVRGDLSAADLCGVLWDIGLDPS